MKNAPTDRPPARFWNRHSNPMSGWSRLASFPVLLATIYYRKPTALLATAAFVAVNPVLFPEPDERTVENDWMYRGVRAEEFWLGEGRALLGTDYPGLLNLLNLPVTGYALLSALRRKPVGTLVGGAASMALKLLFVQALIRHHEERETRDGVTIEIDA